MLENCEVNSTGKFRYSNGSWGDFKNVFMVMALGRMSEKKIMSDIRHMILQVSGPVFRFQLLVTLTPSRMFLLM